MYPLLLWCYKRSSLDVPDMQCQNKPIMFAKRASIYTQYLTLLQTQSGICKPFFSRVVYFSWCELRFDKFWNDLLILYSCSFSVLLIQEYINCIVHCRYVARYIYFLFKSQCVWWKIKQNIIIKPPSFMNVINIL